MRGGKVEQENCFGLERGKIKRTGQSVNTIDHHVHIGQWRDAYFYAQDVFAALKKRGVKECWFSSTTSCIYCKESQAAKNNAEIYKNAPTAAELYQSVRYEVKNALQTTRELGIATHALYWVVPDIVRAGIGIEQAMSETHYEGFKIHPIAQEWNLSLPADYDIAEEIFCYAEKHNLRVLIHTGQSEDDTPRKFEPLVKSHPNCLVQLAHLKDLDAQEYMLKTYANVVVDSAFATQEQVDELLRRGIPPERILYGSDFPINNAILC